MNAVTDSDISRIARVLPSFATLPAELREAVAQNITLMNFPAGASIFRERDGCTGLPIVLRGRVRVARRLPNGHEVGLYDVEAGETCVLSTSCLLGGTSYGAHGDCLTDVEIAVLPTALFDRLVAEHRPFREDVFHIFGERLMRLMELVEAVGFQRLDQRLAAALLGRGQRIETSHEQLARELGVSRESVSRQLKHFEEKGWVKLGRGAIEIVQPRALRAQAAGGQAAVTAVTDPSGQAS
jgi:CRP/FNR family transcriptional regulator